MNCELRQFSTICALFRGDDQNPSTYRGIKKRMKFENPELINKLTENGNYALSGASRTGSGAINWALYDAE